MVYSTIGGIVELSGCIFVDLQIPFTNTCMPIFIPIWHPCSYVRVDPIDTEATSNDNNLMTHDNSTSLKQTRQ